MPPPKKQYSPLKLCKLVAVGSLVCGKVCAAWEMEIARQAYPFAILSISLKSAGNSPTSTSAAFISSSVAGGYKTSSALRTFFFLYSFWYTSHVPVASLSSSSFHPTSSSVRAHCLPWVARSSSTLIISLTVAYASPSVMNKGLLALPPVDKSGKTSYMPDKVR